MVNAMDGESANDLLRGFVEIRNHPSLFREGTINDFINTIMSEIAMDLREARTFSESQSTVMEVIDNQRIQVKGVNMDEEMVNLVFFQHHFMASSRLITVINEIYDNMINRMGV